MDRNAPQLPRPSLGCVCRLSCPDPGTSASFFSVHTLPPEDGKCPGPAEWGSAPGLLIKLSCLRFLPLTRVSSPRSICSSHSSMFRDSWGCFVSPISLGTATCPSSLVQAPVCAAQRKTLRRHKVTQTLLCASSQPQFIEEETEDLRLQPAQGQMPCALWEATGGQDGSGCKGRACQHWTRSLIHLTSGTEQCRVLL